jgi:hypothetical protein
MPPLDDVLDAHLALLRLRGRAERTISERRYAVLRLGAWLRADGWVLCLPYGTEGDRVRVIRREIDAG